MTSKRQKADGYLLPEVIETPELICVKLMIPNDEQYIADFVGHLYELTKWWNWDKSYTAGDTRATRAALFWRKLLHAHLVIGDCGPTERTCTDYTPSAPIVSYFPVDPFKQPDTVPLGYLLAPFTTVQSGDLINAFLGYLPGDVITTISRIPLSSLGIGIVNTIGLPKIGIKLPTGGDLTLKLLSIESGGLARVFVDGKQVAEEDLEYLELQFPVQSTKEIEVELTLEKGQPHTVTIQFEPKLTLAPPFLGFGGGLRSFTFCTEETVKETPYITECEDELNLRINPDKCWIIQAQCSDGTWQDWYNPFCDAASGNAGIGQPGQEDTPVEAGGCRSWPVTLSGNGRWLLPVPINDGDQITITSAKGAWSDGTLLYYFPQGTGFVLGAAAGNAPVHSDDPLQTVNHMRLIAQFASTYVDALTPFTVPDGTGAQQLYFQANDSDLSNNYGDVYFNVELCKAADPATLPENQKWCFTADVKQSEYSFVPTNIDASVTTWVLGTGFEGTGSSGDFNDTFVVVKVPMSGTGKIVSVTIIGKSSGTTVGTKTLGVVCRGNAAGSGGYTVVDNGPINTEHTFIADALNLDIQDLWLRLQIDAPSTPTNGTAIIDRIIITGTGDNPFGNSNC